jgi:hypothetical protein
VSFFGSQEALLEFQGVGLSTSRRMVSEFADPLATPFAMVFLSLFILSHFILHRLETLELAVSAK